MNNLYDFIIVGGGIIGLATAYQLNHRFPNKKIVVLEKEKQLAMHQTGHNSGVIHSGIYYKPGSYKARTCVEGRRALVDFAQKHHIPHDICGKLIVATHESELTHMNRVFNNGQANGVKGLEIVDNQQIKDIEPYCEGIAAIWVPETGIIDFQQVAQKYADILIEKFGGSQVLINQEVLAFTQHEGYTEILTKRGGRFRGKYIITCAGLQSDRIAKKQGAQPSAIILPFRGDYYKLSEVGMSKVRNLIYPVPNPKFPFLGVHFTRMIDGSVECGPNAVFAFKREEYSKFAFSWRDTMDALRFVGTWRFFAKHWRFGLEEYKRAYSKRLFLSSLQKLIPSLRMADIEPARCGIRAQTMEPEGEAIDDFRIERHENAIHVLNAPSPAATASLAIGSAIVDMAVDNFDLV